MKKKVLTIIGALLLCMGAQAQIVSSTSSIIRTERTITAKPTVEKMWYVRGGLNIMNLSGDNADALDGAAGYNLTFGYQKPIGTVGTYWGMEFGLGSRGYSLEEELSGVEYSQKTIAHNLQYSPFTFGYKYEIIDNIAVDAHIGVYASVDYLGNTKMEVTYSDGETEKEDVGIGDWSDWTRYDAGLNIGAGVWYGRFNLDLTYQHGFVKTTGDCNASNFMIRLGVAF